MSEVEEHFIKLGYWVNHAHGPIMGRTITVKTSASMVVIAFLAILASFALGHLFNILIFVAYHIRNRIYKQRPDGLFRQQQVLLRTLPTPSALVTDAIKLWYSWRFISKKALSRSALIISMALVYAIGMTAAGVFTSSVVSSTSIEVLVNSPYCRRVGDYAVDFFFSDMSKKTNIASFAYADEYYKNNSSVANRCRVFTAPRIPFTTTISECPFPRVGCDSPALAFDSNLLDVRDHFGFNLADNDKVTYRRRVTCSIISSSNHSRLVPASRIPSYLRLRPYYPYEEFLVYNMGSRTGIGDFGEGNVTFLQSLVDSNTSVKFEMK